LARFAFGTSIVGSGSEAELVAVARQSALAAVKDHARKTRLPVVDAEGLYARQRAARRVRHWRDELGMLCFTGAVTPEVGIPFLEPGAPPDFDGVSFVEAGCHRRHHLEWDHVNPVANGGPTCYDNLKPRCWPHHRDKTEHDRRAGLLGGQPP
jgi:hypothetical protein